MNFYQQKYFKPYHKIVTEPYAQRRRDSRDSPSPPRHHQPSNFSPEPPSGGFERSPFKHIQAEQVAEPIWEHLYNRGIQSQKELLQRHNQSKNRIDTECTFHPIVRPNRRYLASSSSNFLERVTIWQEHKLEKMIREKEEGVNKDLKECTFTPHIKDIPIKSRLENVEGALQKSNTKQPSRPNIAKKSNPYYSPLKTAKYTYRPATSPAKTPQKVQISFAKNIIRSELRRIAI